MMGGFVRFDPDNWEPPSGEGAVAKAANPAEASATLATLAGLPAEVTAGLGLLRSMPCPAKVDSAAWKCAVRDALSLGEHWAARAYALGWSDLDLFGASSDGNPYGDGLAVWLSGRKLKALTGEWAAADDAKGAHHFFNRPRAERARLLWRLGR